MRTNTLIRVLVSVIIISFVVFYVARVIQENFLLSKYISKIEKSQSIEYPYTDKDILALRDFIYYDIDFTCGTIATARPQIGWTVRQILKKRQGLCGEGSRLIYHILRKNNVPSRRLYLHGNNTLHVIIEYRDNEGSWVLLETINGPGEEFLQKLDEDNITIDSLFNFGPYRYHVTPKPFAAQFGYNNFSYYPLNGLLNNSRFKTEVYVHRPMNSYLNYLSETHEVFLIKFLLVLLLLVNIDLIVRLIRQAFYKLTSK